MAMSDLHFKDDGVEVKSFEDADYDLLPQDLIGSKKIVGKLKDIMADNFQELLKRARKRLG